MNDYATKADGKNMGRSSSETAPTRDNHGRPALVQTTRSAYIHTYTCMYTYIYIYIYTYIYIYVYIYGKSAYQGKPHVLYDMRKLLGWLETRLAQIALDHIKLA